MQKLATENKVLSDQVE
jgi:hypothetical protein